MILNELREHLHDIVVRYFVGAEVVWAQEKLVKPVPTLVTLKLGNVSRPVQPIVEEIDGAPCGCYPSRVLLDVNLYTKGAAFRAGDKQIAARVNTAVNDLLDFVNYVNSPYVTALCNALDIDISFGGSVNDLSGYINDIHWEYRAMTEFSVGFTQTAVGAAGILLESSVKTAPINPDQPGVETSPYISPEWQPTASGGGSEEIALETAGYFENVKFDKAEFK